MAQNTKRKFRYLIGLLILVGLIGGFLYFQFSKSKPAEAAWFDESWLYRQKTEITNSSSAQTDFQVLITLDTATLITASKMQSDCDDIRITDINGKLLSHWLEPSTCNTSTSKIWAKVPSIPTSGATVYIYYGNPSASSVSSPTNTFIREISGVQAGWNMDESSWTNDCSTNTALDSSGQGNHGKSCPASTGPNTTSTAQFGRAGSFDGSNDYVDAGNGASLNIQQSVTIEAWVKPNDVSNNQVVGKGYRWPYAMKIEDGYIVFGVTWSDDTLNYLWGWPQNVVTGVWQHLVIVRDYSTGTIKYYYNGTNTDTKTGYTKLMKLTTWNVEIGRPGGNEVFFNGTIDEVRIYNKALSAAEISDLYGTGGDRQGYVTSNYPNKSLVRKYSANVSVGSPSSEERGPGPVAFWKFDEGYGQTANDTTLNNNDGILGSTSGSDTNDPTWQTEDMCVSGKCLKFDGTDDYVNAGNGASLNITSAITIEAWVKPTGNFWYPRIVSKENGATFAYEVNISADNADRKLVFQTSAFSPGYVVSSLALDMNSWNFIAVTFDGAQVFFRVNNKTETFTKTGTMPTVATNLILGARSSDKGNVWNGFIDDVRIYPYARTAAQIKADYASRGMAKGASAVIASEAKQSLSNGLVAYYKMDESSWTNDCSTATVTDSSGAGNNGKSCPASTGPNTTSTAKFSRAGSFDGSDDYVDAGNGASLNITSAITISAWLKVGTLGVENYVVGKNYGSGVTPYQIMISTANKPVFRFFDGSWRTVTGNTVLTTGIWYHIVGTYDKSLASANFKIFVAGVQENTANYTGSIPTNTESFYIGYYEPSYHFSGQIDEVRIYNRALSPKEVRDLYNWAPGPVAYWNMDENTGQSANDSSGSGNTGTLGASSGTDSSDPTWAVGKFGAGLQFDGSDDYVSVPNSASLNNLNTLTMEVWVKPNAGYGQETPRVWDKGGSFRGYINAANGIFISDIRDANGDFQGAVNSPNSIPINTWTHIAVTLNSGTPQNLRLYINGIFVATGANLTNPTTYTYNLNIGGVATRYFSGLIDDVRIYNYARTQKQIIEDMLARQSLSGGGNADCDNTVLCTKFDEGYGSTAQDSSPQNNDGTLYPGSGGTNTTTAQMWSNSAKFGKAMEFDGTDDYVDAGNGASLNITGAITIEAWVNTTKITHGNIVSRSHASPWNSYAFSLGYNGADVNGVLGFYSGGTWVGTTGNAGINDGSWHHVSVTNNGTTTKIYKDGLEIYSTSQGSPSSDATQHLEIGRHGGINSFSGLIDEVKIYNYALTEDEIKLEYNRGAAVHLGSVSTGSDGTTPSYSSDRSYCIPGDTSTCNPPVAEWTFNEKTGQSANDSSGSGNTGTLGASSGTDSADPTWVSAKVGAGLQFDGTNDYVSVPDSNSLDITNAITLETWVNIKAASTNMLVNKEAAYLSRTLSNNYFMAHVYVDGDYRDCTDVVNPSLNLGQWYQVAYTYDVVTRTIITYQNGKQGSSCVLTGLSNYNIGQSTASLLIGSFWGNYPNGSIDDVRIYNYARTPAQIAWDYNRGKPVAHWKFDECQGATAYDASGNANHGTTTIGASGTQTGIGTCTDANTANARYNGRNGKYNSALNFDGTDDYVDAGNGTSLNITDAITIEAWVKLSTLQTYNAIVRKGSSPRYYIQINDSAGNKKMQLALSGTTAGGVVGNRVFTSSDIGTWFHLVGTYNGSISAVYINGVLDKSQSDSGSISAITGNLRIGNDLSGNYFSGLIDEVKIFNYALTPQQIKNEYNEGAAIRFGPSTGSP